LHFFFHLIYLRNHYTNRDVIQQGKLELEKME